MKRREGFKELKPGVFILRKNKEKYLIVELIERNGNEHQAEIYTVKIIKRRYLLEHDCSWKENEIIRGFYFIKDNPEETWADFILDEKEVLARLI